MLIAFSPIFAVIISQHLYRVCEKAKLYYTRKVKLVTKKKTHDTKYSGRCSLAPFSAMFPK